MKAVTKLTCAVGLIYFTAMAAAFAAPRQSGGASTASSPAVVDAGSHWTAAPGQDARQNPLATRPDTRAGGAKLFQQRCAACHRADGTGTSRGPNLTTSRVQRQSDGALYWKISSGNTRTGMPSFSAFPELQRWQLVSHVRALAE